MTLYSYIVGFVFSLILTLSAFWFTWSYVTQGMFSATVVATVLVLLAIAQLLVQLKFFLHIGKKTNEWNWGALIFALLVVVFVVGGSLWIMSHLQHTTDIPFDGIPSVQTEH